MKTVYLTAVIASILSWSSSYAHDEGHGPKLADAGKYGGLVSAVIAKDDIKLGANAPLIHKAELVRSTDGTLRVYMYDKNMKPLNVKSFEPKAYAILAAKVKGKWVDTEFPLEVKENAFIGKMPKVTKKPYNIDVTVKENGKELLSAFDNLD